MKALIFNRARRETETEKAS